MKEHRSKALSVRPFGPEGRSSKAGPTHAVARIARRRGKALPSGAESEFMNPNRRDIEVAREAAFGEVLLTKDDLAKRLRLKRRGVECLVARRMIPVIRISRRCVQFSWKAVKEALTRHEIKEVGRK